MDSFWPIFAVVLIAAILVVFLQSSRLPVLGMILSLATGLLILMIILPRLSQVVQVFNQVANKANLNSIHLNTLLKIIAITYVAEFGGQMCKDVGQGALASKIELSAKVLIMLLAIPIIVSILDSIIGLLP